jgi:LPS export ABC transporter protein LptC
MTNLLKKHWPLIAIVALLVVVSFYLTKPGKKIVQEPVAEDIAPKEGLKLKDIHYTQDDPDARIKWTMDAKEVIFSEDRNFIVFHDFRLEVAPEDKPWFKLNGQKGEYYRDSGDMTLWGNLVGWSENGYRINTELIHINEKQGYMKTDKPVKIFGPFFSVKGRGLFMDLEKESVEILSDVTTTIFKESLT